jgi:hypothetical protein
MDEPILMAGERLGISPLDLREGLTGMPKGGLRRALYDDYRSPTKARGTGSVMNLYDVWDPYAPERSEPGYSIRGRVQPPEAYGA